MKTSTIAIAALAGLKQVVLGGDGGARTANGPPSIVDGRPKGEVIQPSLPEIIAAQATATAASPTSAVKGLAFDRIIQVWLENTNYDAAAAEGNFKWFAERGILLTNFFAVTHPSQPNYVASAAGDHFGMDHDDFYRFPENISTVFDLLDTKGISWAAYQEGMPHAGFQGFNFSNQQNFRNNYVRKHNPPVQFDSVTVIKGDPRLSQTKNFTSFYEDVSNNQLPQWIFITPNMTNDGHDTNYRFSASWSRAFFSSLLNDTSSFNTDRTLIMLTFDEDEVYKIPNRIFTVLLGGAVPSHLRGTRDEGFYTHYSTIASVSTNWDLPSLGRWDCGANVFDFVAVAKANATGTPKRENVMPAGIVTAADQQQNTKLVVMGASYPGPTSNKLFTPGWWPVPDTQSACSAGNGVLGAVKARWAHLGLPSYNYSDAWPYDVRSGSNTEAVSELGGGKPIPEVNAGGSGSGSAARGSGSGSTSSSGGASARRISGGTLAVAAAVAAGFFGAAAAAADVADSAAAADGRLSAGTAAAAAVWLCLCAGLSVVR